MARNLSDKSNRNNQMWINEVFDVIPIFNDHDNEKDMAMAYKYAERLADGGRLNQSDILDLAALLAVCCGHIPERSLS